MKKPEIQTISIGYTEPIPPHFFPIKRRMEYSVVIQVPRDKVIVIASRKPAALIAKAINAKAKDFLLLPDMDYHAFEPESQEEVEVLKAAWSSASKRYRRCRMLSA